MSKTVDERVVEMRFDNKNFESNVKTTMSTLDKLKQSLKFDGAAKSMQSIEAASKNVNLSGISNAIDSVQVKFSALQVMAVTALSNITNSVVNLGKKILKAIPDQIIQGGKTRAMNLENAHFQLQGLLQDEEAVSAVMQNVNDSVDGTAYSLDSAAKVASQFAASGMRAGDQMFKSLRAVAGVAAQTNSEYDDIGNVFTTVAGNGRLMGDQLLQLSSRGLNAAATIAKYLGKTESEVRDMVSKGKISFEMFANAMDDAFGEHAKKANETFTGALSNIRAALARIGALFISPLVEQNGALVQLFNAVREKINDIKTAITPVANVFVAAVTTMANALTKFLKGFDIKKPFEKIASMFTSKWSKFEKQINDVGITTEDFQDKLKEVANEHGISLDELIQKYGSLGKAISSGKISKNIIVETLQNITDTIKRVSDAGETISDITSKLETFNKVTGQIINGDFGNGEDRVRALTDAGYEYATMQKLVNYIWERNGHSWSDCNISAEELTNVIGELSQEELKNIGYTEEQAEKIRQLAEEAEKTGTPLNELISQMQKPSTGTLLLNSVNNALTGLSSIIKAVKNAWIEMVSPMSTGLFSGLAETISNFSKKLILSEEQINSLTRVFKGLFAVLDMVRSVVGGALSVAFKVVRAVLSSFNISVLDLLANIGDAVVKFRNWISQHNYLKKILDLIVPIIKEVATAVYEWVKNNELIQNGISKLTSLLDSALGKISEWVDGLKETDNIPQYIISGLVNGIKSGISTVSEVMINLGKAILNAIKSVLGIHSPSTEFFEIGSNIIAGLINGIKNGISSLLSLVGDIGQKCIDIFKNIDFGKIFAVGISAGIIYIANDILKVIKMFAAPAAGIGKMTSSIGGFFDTLSERIKPNKLKNVSSAVRDFAIAIGILAASVYVLAQLDSAKMWGAVGALTALAGVMALLSLAASKLDASGGNFKQLSLTLVGIAAALYMMSSALKKLEFLNDDNITPVLGAFTAIIVGFVAILAALSILANSPGQKDISKAGLIILEISAAMLLMTTVIKALSSLDKGALEKGIGCMTLFGVLITGLMAATKLIGNGSGRIGTNMLKISAAMLLMVAVMKAVSGLEPNTIAKGIVCMTLFSGLITGLMAATKLISTNNIDKIGSAILGVSAAMTLMALTIKIVSNMDAGSIAKGITCITLFGGIVTGLMAATRLAGGNDLKGVSTTLLAMSVSIGILGAVAIGLSLIDTKGLAKGIAAVGMLSGMMALMVHATKDAQNCKGNIIALTVSIGLMAAAIAALSFIDGTKLAGATIALGTIMGMFALMEKAASGANKAMGSIIVMTVAVGLLAGMLALLSKLPVESLIASSASLSTLLLSISASFAIIGLVGKASASAIGSLALMGLVVGELAVILGLMSKFNVAPSIETAISLSILLLSMSASLVILSAIGTTGPAAFIGIGALATLITAIGALMVGIGALMEYVPGMQAWLDTGMAVLEQIGYGIGAFFGNIAGGFLEGASSGLPEVGENLSAFMDSAKPFFDGISGVGTDALNGVKILAETFMLLAGANFVDSVASWLTGESSFDTFGEKLVPLAEGIKKYSEIVKGIDTSGVTASVTAGKAIAELAQSLPNSGGLAGLFAGNNDIDVFGAMIVPFGESIKEYCETVMGIDTSGVAVSVSAGKLILELAEALPNSGGVAGFFAGNNDIDTFGKQLLVFGQSIKDYCVTVNGMDTSGVEKSLTAGKSILDLTGTLSDNGLNAVNFCEGIKTIAKGLVDFSKSICDIDLSNVSNITNALQSLGEVGIANLVNSFAGAEQTLSQTGSNLVIALISGIATKTPDVTNAAINLVESAATSLKIGYQSFYSAGGYLVQGFANGISANTYLATAQASAMAKAADTAARAALGVQSPSKAFIAIGKYVGEGLAIGLRESTRETVNASADMANGVLTAAKYSLEKLEDYISNAEFFDEITLAEKIEIYEAALERYAEGSEEWLKINKSLYSAYKEYASEQYQVSIDWIDKEKEYHRLSLEDMYAAYERVQARYKKDSDEWRELEEKKIADTYQYSMDWISREKEYNRLSLADELAAYERVQARYKYGTDEWLEMEEKKYETRNSLVDESYQNSIDWISREKDYDRLGTAGELAAYTRVQYQLQEALEKANELDVDREAIAEKLADTEATLYQLSKGIYEAQVQYNKDRESIEKEAADKRIEYEEDYKEKCEEVNKQLAQDIDDLNKAYADAVESRAQSIYDSFNLFDEVSKKDKVNANSLTRNLQDQVAEIEDWRDQLNSLSAKGLNKSLIEELQEMGPSSIAELKALNSMTDSQLMQYADLWADKHRLANDKATSELEDMRTETDSQITQLREDADAELEELKNTFDTNISDLNTSVNEQLNDLTTNFKKQVGLLPTYTDEELNEMVKVASDIMSQAGWNSLGEDIVDGLIEGIEFKAPTYYDKVKEIMINAEAAAREAVDSHSPSRTFAAIGRDLDLGLIVGLQKYSENVASATAGVGEQATEAMRNAIAGIGDKIDSDIDYVPTIRPIIDLTDVNDGIGYMNNAFAAERSMTLGMSAAFGNQNGKWSQLNELSESLSKMNEQSVGKIADSIDGLRADFEGLLERVSQMQVVMDSGALVGAIAPNMDGAIGGITRLRRRGVK